MKTSLSAAPGLFRMASVDIAADETTWVLIDNKVYGAKADTREPSGGEKGYMGIITKGDFTASNLETLLAALSEARRGQVVFIPGETEIDITASPNTPVVIRGVPQQKCDIRRNWFPNHGAPADAVHGLAEKTNASDNAYGEEPTAAK